MLTYEEERYAGETIAHRVRRELADARAGKEKTDRFISEELPFVFDQEQYLGDKNMRGRRRPDRIRPTDSAPYDHWRYTKGIALQSFPVYIRCKSVDPDADQDRVEDMKHRIDYQLSDNRFCNYADVRERWIGGALAARAWAYRWDFVPFLGSHGEVIPVLVDPRMLFWPSGYMTPHDPLCPRLHNVFRIPINEARMMPNWKNTDRLKPDAGTEILEWLQHLGAGTAGDRVYFEDGASRSDQGSAEGMVTFCMTWYRFELGKVKVPKEIPLAPGMRYLVCLNEPCSFQSPREYELADILGDSNYRLPVNEECTRCGATMVRRDKEIRTEEQMRYEKGKRLLITCLNGSVEDEMYDDPWPAPDCPTFPYAWLTCDKEPHRAIPESDVSVNMNITIGRNFTMGVIYEQAHRSKPIQLWPRVGIEGANAVGLDHMDELEDVMFYTSDMPPNPVQVVQSLPVNRDLFELYSLLRSAYKENSGDSRISIGAGETKDIAVGTLKQMIDSGNVPINTFGKSIYAAESISFTSLACYIRKFDTEERKIGYRDKHTFRPVMKKMRGIDLPDVDVLCSAGPSLSNINAEEIQAAIQLRGLDPATRRIIGRAQGVDESLLDELDEAQAAQPAMPLAAQPGPQPNKEAATV